MVVTTDSPVTDEVIDLIVSIDGFQNGRAGHPLAAMFRLRARPSDESSRWQGRSARADLFFASKIKATLTAAGHEGTVRDPSPPLPGHADS